MSGAPSLSGLAMSWQLEPAVLAWALAAAVLYVAAARRTRWKARRTVSWLAGIAVVAVALQSGLDVYAGELLSVHMVQHLALTMLAAPLLVAGAPVTLALRTLRGRSRRAVARALSSPTGATLGRPVVGLAQFVAVTLLTHLTGFYELALRHPGVHVLEHALYLTSAALFWAPLVGADPIRHAPGWLGRMLAVLLAMPAMSVVGIALEISGRVRYPAYLAPARAMGVSALADQHDAGAIMWVGGSLAGALIVLGLAWAALAGEERRARAREAHADRRAAEAVIGT